MKPVFVGIAVAITLSFQAAAETRFMQVSIETIAGRRVQTMDGRIYNFHRDGRMTGQTESGRKLDATWNVEGSGMVKFSLKNGDVMFFQTYKIDGEQFEISTHGNRAPHRSKIVSITSLD